MDYWLDTWSLKVILSGLTQVGLAGIICASAGNDLYHPIQAMLIGAIGVVIAYKMHYWVERKFKIDDAVGAVAVHGYAGCCRS